MLIKTLRKNFSILNFQKIYPLSQEMSDLQENFKEFADQNILPLAEKTDIENKFPIELFPLMGQHGLLGLTCPEKYGGLDLGYTAQSLAMEEISRCSGSIGLSFAVQVRYANEQQAEKYLPELCSGNLIGALAMSETESGSDVTSMKTKAVKQGKNWILNGRKMWITNGPIADVIIVYAKTENNKISAFIVEKNMQGYSVAQKLDKLGMRGSDTGELVFEDVIIPEENLLGEEGKGVYILMSGLDYERLVLSAGPVGIMQACLDTSLNYVTQRKQFNKKIGEFQLMQGKLADMYTKLQSSRCFLYSLCEKADKGICDNNETASLIYLTSENAVQVSLEALQCLGGNGYVNEYPTGRYLRDAKLYTIGAGTNEIRQWLIGRNLVKEWDKQNNQ